ncbi:taurine ABC transporter substrate-binding protein [Rhizobium bangladeshense]|uniref:taurine ABC transporter substrate-binding protein n=1 Tax=Rhizobium bangladeshense TaxID=1138189 RepID=UPI001C83FA0E|nr:taurine ABC transporter substrate-binding protein [Rhizobium bangladeshense]MBX4898681.1 taurine ABC transporter substrate-binding protein [Rhizobium bangladeshense]MBX4905572.1 taurine ABC transporter substrate-binding protein [Rhizobium bangladeshense]MBX4915839.1 taurine ABC transporter substrate-binding protein [Rhizobium bangladeshense]MBY3616640.1 taurine ABC transporter substrate-binding protein [Rhizobium bangladeshense]
MNRLSKAFASLAVTCSAVLGISFGAAAQDKSVTFAYQDMMTPIRVLMESGKLESETGYKIKWVKFGGGGDVIRAMSSGDVDIGEAGSSPVAAAASQGLPIKLFWILDDIANAEQLVARNGSGIKTISDLKGKTVAVPFVSTSHYQLMYALSEAGLSSKDVKLLNMRPPEIAAAWERGDVDATFIWAPVLDVAKKSGTVIASAGDFAAKGKATFDGIVVTDKFAAANKEFMTTFVKLLGAADADYTANKASWTPDSKPVAAVVKWTGANAADVPAGMAAYKFPTLDEQASADWLGGGAAKALQSTAEFLKEQGRVTELAPDYAAFVTDEYVKAAK